MMRAKFKAKRLCQYIKGRRRLMCCLLLLLLLLLLCLLLSFLLTVRTAQRHFPQHEFMKLADSSSVV
jgi:hypothetical protein